MNDPNKITDFELTTVKGISILFSFDMLDFDKLPEGIYGYNISYMEENWMVPISISSGPTDRFFGALLSNAPLPLEAGALIIDPGEDLRLFNPKSYSLSDYMNLEVEEKI